MSNVFAAGTATLKEGVLTLKNVSIVPDYLYDDVVISLNQTYTISRQAKMTERIDAYYSRSGALDTINTTNVDNHFVKSTGNVLMDGVNTYQSTKLYPRVTINYDTGRIYHTTVNMNNKEIIVDLLNSKFYERVRKTGNYTGYNYNEESRILVTPHSHDLKCINCSLDQDSASVVRHWRTYDGNSGTTTTTYGEWDVSLTDWGNYNYVYAGLGQARPPVSTFTDTISFNTFERTNLDVKEINLNNCNANNIINIKGSFTINGGIYGGEGGNYSNNKDFGQLNRPCRPNYTYRSAPALDDYNIIVNKGTIKDIGSSFVSKFTLGDESEQIIGEASNGVTITTVKLSNPPIIIDWGTMPPLDINWDGLNLDFNAPTIEVIRNPANQKQPTASVTLTIRATDPDGNDSPTPISINGGTFVASPATYTAREKEVVNISARDSKGNVRDYSVNISNIDNEAPYVTSMTQSNTVWTKTPVVVTVKAEDDVKLHATPYKYEFTPNSTGHTTVSGWTANRTFSATENGTLRVGVRDTLYTNDSNTEHFSWSEPYYIRNIDKISPSATVAYSVPASQKVSEKVGVTVYVTPVDNADRVTGESSGISNTPIAWTEGAFTAQLEKTFYANGTYYFWIKDALGNISDRKSVTINQIVSDNTTKPVINSLSQNKTTGQVSAPVTITVNASKGPNGPNLSNQPFSWDGGVTWTNNPNFDVNKNGTYTVIVKDINGNTTEQSITISNIDDNKPTASLFLYKGQPEDWDMAYGPALVTDYVWKLRVEANDLGSGLQQVVTNWDNRTINTPSTPFTTVFDVTEPGVYGVKVVDKCGNETYVEKTITAESIGAGIWGVGGGSTGGAGGTGTGTGGKGFGTIIDVPSTGSAGSSIFPGGASLQDLVFSPNSVYNIATGEIKGYPPGKAGIPIHLLFTATRNHYVTGTATFNGVEYPLYFPENGNANWIKSIGRQNVAEGFIPINTVTSDVKNGRIKISFKEYSDQSLSTLVSEGSATLYTSTQITKPTIGYVYNKATDQLTVNASTTVAGVDKVQVDLGSGYQDYTGPVTVGGASTIKVKVTDKAGNVSEITIDGSTLPMTGSSGGSIPTTDKDNVGATGSDGDTVNSYHTSNRSADIFIVGGNRSNTNSVPDSSIYDLTD